MEFKQKLSEEIFHTKYMINGEKSPEEVFEEIAITIASEEKKIIKESYKLIPESLKWLGINYNKKILYKSDRLKLYYKYAEELIKLGRAYVCSCRPAKLRENRKKPLGCFHMPV